MIAVVISDTLELLTFTKKHFWLILDLRLHLWCIDSILRYRVNVIKNRAEFFTSARFKRINKGGEKQMLENKNLWYDVMVCITGKLIADTIIVIAKTIVAVIGQNL